MRIANEQVRQNQGISLDYLSTPPPPTFVPPLLLLTPWLLNTVDLLDWRSNYKKSVVNAFKVLCLVTLTETDQPLSREYLSHFYRVIHNGLVDNSSPVHSFLSLYIYFTRFFSFSIYLEFRNHVVVEKSRWKNWSLSFEVSCSVIMKDKNFSGIALNERKCSRFLLDFKSQNFL